MKTKTRFELKELIIMIKFSGHGPFSHLWEGFVNKANPGLNWAHEDSSIRMLDYLIQDNNLMPILAALGDINAQVSFSYICFKGQ
jgi:HD superfamily phosphohydrolase